MIGNVGYSNNSVEPRQVTLNFKGNILQNNSFENIDTFVTSVNAKAKKNDKGGLMSRLVTSPTAVYCGLSVPILYEIYSIVRICLKNIAKDKAGAKLIAQKSLKNLKWFLPLGLGVFAGLQYLFNQNTDKNFAKLEEKFNSINTNTSAKLSKETFNANVVDAYYTFSNGNIIFNKRAINDPYYRKAGNQEKLIEHELEHAHQSELIARSKDGIKKLNYSIIQMSTIEELKKDEKFKKGIVKLYNEAINDDNGKYDGKKIKLGLGVEVDAKNFIIALYMLINRDNVHYNDLPIFIDSEHYQKVIDEKGPLTPEEEKLADIYFDALTNYTDDVNFLSVINRSSSYHTNELEKEAYKTAKK